MVCYIDSLVTFEEVVTDIKELIPDAALRRRMSRILKMAVSTGVECAGGVDAVSGLDAIVTATGWGCLEDSEKFLRNMIAGEEQMLNPTPFIQSTFNTVGGQIALLRHNHCYNVTYVNRSHSFEDALLDVMMRIADGESSSVLVGAFDEQTPSQHRIMERMGLFRKTDGGEGAVFAHITDRPCKESFAKVTLLEFPSETISYNECLERYATCPDAEILYCAALEHGVFPVMSAYSFASAAKMIKSGKRQVLVYNEYFGAAPTVLRIECLG